MVRSRAGNKLHKLSVIITACHESSVALGIKRSGDTGAIRCPGRVRKPFRVIRVLPGDRPTNHRNNRRCLFLSKTNLLEILNRLVSVKCHRCQAFKSSYVRDCSIASKQFIA